MSDPSQENRYQGTIRANELAAEEFTRTGQVPSLSVILNQGTGHYSVSWFGQDCENGMTRIVHQVPRARRTGGLP